MSMSINYWGKQSRDLGLCWGVMKKTHMGVPVQWEERISPEVPEGAKESGCLCLLCSLGCFALQDASSAGPFLKRWEQVLVHLLAFSLSSTLHSFRAWTISITTPFSKEPAIGVGMWQIVTKS